MRRPDAVKLLIALAVFVCAGGFFAFRRGNAEDEASGKDGAPAAEAADVFEAIPAEQMKKKPPSARIDEDIG